jgi:hypothetical protein
MTTSFKEYTVDIVDDAGYSLASTDNLYTYDRVYSEDTEYPTSKHGIRITKDGQTVASVIICESGGKTGIHDNSFVITGDVLYVCCSNAVYAFRLPELTLNWKKKLDAATCFAIYPFKDDFIIHGELEVKRIDKEGKIKWNFSAKDIFVTQDDGEAVKFIGDNIELTDWDGDRYLLNEDGRLSK